MPCAPSLELASQHNRHGLGGQYDSESMARTCVRLYGPWLATAYLQLDVCGALQTDVCALR